MKFLVKMTGNSNTLSLYYQTFSGNKTLLWRLHGNHGDLWTSASITYHPDGNFAVRLSIICSFFHENIICSSSNEIIIV